MSDWKVETYPGCKDELEGITDSSGDLVGRELQLPAHTHSDDVVGSIGHRGAKEDGSEDNFHCKRNRGYTTK